MYAQLIVSFGFLSVVFNWALMDFRTLVLVFENLEHISGNVHKEYISFYK